MKTVKAFYDLADRILDSRVLEIMDMKQTIRYRSEDEEVSFCVFGRESMISGIGVYFEEDANSLALFRMADNIGMDRVQALYAQAMLMVSFEDMSGLNEEQKQMYQECGRTYEYAFPVGYSFLPGYLPAIADAQDIETLIKYLNLFLEIFAVYKKEFLPPLGEMPYMIEAQKDGDHWILAATDDEIAFGYDMPAVNDEKLLARLKRCPHTQEILEIDCRFSGGSGEKTKSGREKNPSLIVLMEERSGKLIDSYLVDDCREADLRVLGSFMQYMLEYGIPASVCVANDLMEALADELSVTLDFMVRITDLPVIENYLEEHIYKEETE